jgi:hypothetical protein
MDAFLTSDGLLSLLTLTALEIVLGVDNLVFIAIVSGKLPPSQQPLARKIGLGLALLVLLVHLPGGGLSESPILVDAVALAISNVQGETRIPPSPLG